MDNYKKNTIAAIATPPGIGSIGIVRISGDESLNILSNLISKKDIKPRYATLAYVKDSSGLEIDQCVVIYFKGPHSFTGEDVVEIQTHGGNIVVGKILEAVLNLGAVPAKPGEFSERAFLNDKIDLLQAEAISDLINASTNNAANAAINSLKGDFSNKINNLVDKITNLRVYVEASIDFSDEDLDFIESGNILSNLIQINREIEEIISSSHSGALLKDGVKTAILGKPNAGKSSILNRLCKDDVAIVTPIAGTTRDVIKQEIVIDGLILHLLDTAGIRETEDVVEKEGIRRSILAANDAGLLILVAEVQDLKSDFVDEFRFFFDSKLPKILLINKIDLLKLSNDDLHKKKNKLKNISIDDDIEILFVSAETNQGISELKSKLKHLVGYNIDGNSGVFSTRVRHLKNLRDSQEKITLAVSNLEKKTSLELVAEDLHLASQYLGEITGRFYSDDLLGKIFSSFCIGK